MSNQNLAASGFERGAGGGSIMGKVRETTWEWDKLPGGGGYSLLWAI